MNATKHAYKHHARETEERKRERAYAKYARTVARKEARLAKEFHLACLAYDESAWDAMVDAHFMEFGAS